ncbi:hypothetical protein CPC08DRAFT_820152 [Agrocybe pediades]|nr:hypothetical protein CPC08DRAFT_820152 [Agrocybe pediades]
MLISLPLPPLPTAVAHGPACSTNVIFKCASAVVRIVGLVFLIAVFVAQRSAYLLAADSLSHSHFCTKDGFLHLPPFFAAGLTRRILPSDAVFARMPWTQAPAAGLSTYVFNPERCAQTSSRRIDM